MQRKNNRGYWESLWGLIYGWESCDDLLRDTRRLYKSDNNCFYTFSNGNLFVPIDDRVSLCDPTRTKLLVRTALGPPGLATTTHRQKKHTINKGQTNIFPLTRCGCGSRLLWFQLPQELFNNWNGCCHFTLIFYLSAVSIKYFFKNKKKP